LEEARAKRKEFELQAAALTALVGLIHHSVD
jgi:hypothetical protein